MQHFLPKGRTQPHRSPQRIRKIPSGIRQRWKMRCQISHHQPMSTPNFCLLSHSKMLKMLHICFTYSLQNLNMTYGMGDCVCEQENIHVEVPLRAWSALYQQFIVCGRLVCQQRLSDLEYIQSSPHGEIWSTCKGSATLLTCAAQRSLAYIRIRKHDLLLHVRAAPLPLNTLRGTTGSLQTFNL